MFAPQFCFDQFKNEVWQNASSMDRAWIEGVVYSPEGGDRSLQFKVASRLHFDFFQNKIQPKLVAWIQENSLPVPDISLHIDREVRTEISQESEIQPSFSHPKQSVQKSDKNLSHYTFDNFIVGVSNEFAFKAALISANSPGLIANPLFIHGSSGLGKTHLSHAICNQRRENFPGSKTLYVTGEKFLNDFVDHIKSGRMGEFRQKYRIAPDLLVIDDIHTLGKGEKVQEELFNTLNHYFHENKQVVITSDQSPRELKTFADRIRTRLGGGLILEIDWPDYHLRSAFIETKCSTQIMEFPEDWKSSLALKSNLSMRELEGILRTLVICGKIDSSFLNESYVQRLIAGFEKKENSLQDILERVAATFSIPTKSILSKDRQKDLTFARHVFMFVARECEFSTPEIGRMLGRDHSTVLAGARRIQKRILSDNALKLKVEEILNRFSNEKGLT